MKLINLIEDTCTLTYDHMDFAVITYRCLLLLRYTSVVLSFPLHHTVNVCCYNLENVLKYLGVYQKHVQKTYMYE